MSKKVILQRVWMDENQSTGSLIVLDEFRQPIYISPCIERGDNDGYYDTLASGDALKRFHLTLTDMQEQGTTITIFNSYL